jgi:epoxyqueuosine reductase
MPNQEKFETRLKDKARELGFTKVGVVAARGLTDEAARLREWLARGYHATMGWMERTADKRADPNLVLPGVKSVVVVALNYYSPYRHSSDPETGKISRYAWGDDYHDVLTVKLAELLAWIKVERPDAEGKICVDAQPAMDKVWAARAGFGWIGKHSNLITMDYGSWVFLGELFLTLELEDETECIPNHCGTCMACLDACPTNAIVEPYVVDANRCISFVTIESKSEALELKTENWVFGCDVCQDVCPWSRFQKPTAEARFAPREGVIAPRLEELETLTPEEFSSKFEGSPVKRAKLKGLRRNAAHARGTSAAQENRLDAIADAEARRSE